jgi:hypothetical protein
VVISNTVFSKRILHGREQKTSTARSCQVSYASLNGLLLRDQSIERVENEALSKTREKRPDDEQA